MKDQFSLLKEKAVEYFSFMAITAIVLQAPFIDILILKNPITEISLTECLGEFFLAVIIGIYTYLAIRCPKIRYGMILIAGFFTCMLIREFDFFFDGISVSWCYIAMAITVVCIILAIKNKESTVRGLVDFCRGKFYFIMVCGLVNLFVFSRLLGMGLLWRHLLGDFYVRIVKNAVEEATELFSYTLCLIASVKYARVTLSKKFGNSAI
ncbi:MAG: hypothetical protein ABFC57_13485 [Veillonellales bacterium]